MSRLRSLMVLVVFVATLAATAQQNATSITKNNAQAQHHAASAPSSQPTPLLDPAQNISNNAPLMMSSKTA